MKFADAKSESEMPKYVCHKEVHALKIAKIDGHVITPADDGFAPFLNDESYFLKHAPQVGGYYVVYEDGYKSYSPAAPFEKGYKRI
jgi:hypothetical protein